MPVSSDVHILTSRDLDVIEQKAFQRGVARGKFEERLAAGKERVAATCQNWHEGVCHRCGSQKDFGEVSAEYKCPHWTHKIA